jgi:hypothetical protein
MKSAIKRSLFAGIAGALVALTLRRYNCDAEEPDIDAELGQPADPANLTPTGGPGPVDSLDHSGTPAPILGDQPAKILPRRPAMAAPTVTFSGTVVRSGPHFALRETGGALYPLDSAGRAWPFEGEDVRVTGKLDLDTRLLYVDAIEPAESLLDESPGVPSTAA